MPRTLLVSTDGTEYGYQKNEQHDAACAVCQRPLARQTYVQWG